MPVRGRRSRRYYAAPSGGGGGGPTIDKFASPGGSDGTGTGTELNPYKTLQFLADHLTAGQTGALLGDSGGLYDDQPGGYALRLLRASSPGSSEASPIKIINAPGATVQVRGPLRFGYHGMQFIGGPVGGWGGAFIINGWKSATALTAKTFEIEGDDFLVTGCDLRNNDPAAPTGFATENSIFFLGEVGVYMIGNWKVNRNWMHQMRWGKGQVNQPHGIYADLCYGGEFMHNVLWDIIGPLTSDGCFGMQLYPRCQDVKVWNNLLNGLNFGITKGTQSATRRACTADTNASGSTSLANFTATGSTLTSQIGRRIVGPGIQAGTYLKRIITGTAGSAGPGTMELTKPQTTGGSAGASVTTFESSDGGDIRKNVLTGMANDAIRTLWGDNTSGTPQAEHIAIVADENHTNGNGVNLNSPANGITYTAGTSGAPVYDDAPNGDFDLGVSTTVPVGTGPDTIVRH